jgi:hypothetical protein
MAVAPVSGAPESASRTVPRRVCAFVLKKNKNSAAQNKYLSTFMVEIQ